MITIEQIQQAKLALALYDAQGKEIVLGDVKPGDTVYRRINGKLVAGKVKALSPLTIG